MMSVRPDVLPQAALDELAVLQDAVKPFETAVAIATIEKEDSAAPSDGFFDEISEKPVEEASLAQVYRARLAGTDTYVAVKVQRPEILSTVSKDLYVLRRAAEVYQGLIEDPPRSRGPTTSRCSTSGPWASTPSSISSTRRPTSRGCGTSCWTRRR